MTRGAALTLSCFRAMVKNKANLFLGMLLLLLPPVATIPAIGHAKPNQNIVLTLPAETVLTSLQKALPLEIPSQSRQLQGDIIVESLDSLAIADNAITVRGVLSGRNLVVTTQLAGQPIQLRIGEVRLPVTCVLQTRFDAARRKLYVTPHFNNAGNGNDDLAPLLGALAGHEYLVDLDALETMNIRVGRKTIPVAMDPVHIGGANNALVFQMMPRVGTPR